MKTAITVAILLTLVVSSHAANVEPPSRLKRLFKKVKTSYSRLIEKTKNFFSEKPSSESEKIPVNAKGLRYLALGDSYAAGVGSGGGGLAARSIDLDPCCYRTSNAYPMFVTRKLKAKYLDFRACMGAVAIGGRNSVLEQLRTSPKNVDLVTITVGGNDIGFTSLIGACLLSKLSEKRCMNEIKSSKQKAQTNLMRDIRKLNMATKAHFGPKTLIVFTGYPHPYSEDTSVRKCYSLRVRRGLNSVVALLNKQIRANVDNFVPISFVGNELCGSNKEFIHDELRPAVRRFSDCGVRRALFKTVGGLYHLTIGGQQRYSNSITKWYKNKKRA